MALWGPGSTSIISAFVGSEMQACCGIGGRSCVGGLVKAERSKRRVAEVPSRRDFIPKKDISGRFLGKQRITLSGVILPANHGPKSVIPRQKLFLGFPGLTEALAIFVSQTAWLVENLSAAVRLSIDFFLLGITTFILVD
jgi:hypothetical protein